MTPANTMATVTTCLGAFNTIPRTTADNKPDFSAIPTPSMATSTTPSGAKFTKLGTRFSRIRRRPSAFIRLTASMVAPSAADGRGSGTETPMAPNTPDSRIISSASTANSVTGCGSRLPSHSTESRKRVNQPRFIVLPGTSLSILTSLAQCFFVHLAHGCQGYLGNDVDMFRHFECRHFVAAKCQNFFAHSIVTHVFANF